MALSVTFFPDSLTTHAVLFGCDMKKPVKYEKNMTLADIILSRLSKSDMPVFHPMLLPTIFADIERNRQIELVRDKLHQLGQRILNLATTTSEPPKYVTSVVTNGLGSSTGSNTNTGNSWTINGPLRGPLRILRRLSRPLSTADSMQDEKGVQQSFSSSPPLKKGEIPTSMLWLEISRLRNGLGNWQCHLRKMIGHIEELNATEFDWNKHPGSGAIHSKAKLRQVHEAGERLKERLQELVDEYDEYIRECTHIMDGMTLATQLVCPETRNNCSQQPKLILSKELSHIGRADAKTNLDISKVNLDVAQMTRRDSHVMKSIAVLGMVFLPATFVTVSC